MRYLLTIFAVFFTLNTAQGAALTVPAFSKFSSAGMSVDAGRQSTNTMQVVGARFSKPGGKPTMTITGPEYRIGVDFLSIAAAVSYLGDTPATVYIQADTTVSVNLVVPATLELVPLNGAKINHTTYTISYSGSTSRWPMAQVLNGTGLVSGFSGTVYPDWWGLKGNVAPYDTAAVQAAFNTYANVKFNKNYYVTSVLLDGVNKNRSVDFNGYTLYGIATSATASILEIKENFLTAYKIDVNQNFNLNYICAIQWRSDATHAAAYNKIYGLHIWYALKGLIYGEDIGTSAYDAPQSENTIYSFTTHGVRAPLIQNQPNGFLYLVSPVLNCGPAEWVSEDVAVGVPYNAATWGTESHVFNNAVGVLSIVGGELLKNLHPQGYGFKGQNFQITQAYMEINSSLAYITGDGVKVTDSTSLQTPASTNGYTVVIDAAATGTFYMRGATVIRGAGLAATATNTVVNSSDGSDISASFTVDVSDTSFVEWDTQLYSGAPAFRNVAFRVRNITSSGNSFTTFNVESQNPILVMPIPVSFEAGEQGLNYIVFPEDVTILGVYWGVTKALSGANDGTITTANSVGDCAGGVITAAAGHAIGGGGVIFPTTNTFVAKNTSFSLTTAKATAGGKVLVSLHYRKGK